MAPALGLLGGEALVRVLDRADDVALGHPPAQHLEVLLLGLDAGLRTSKIAGLQAGELDGDELQSRPISPRLSA